MSATDTPSGESLWRPRVVLPFLAVALIWGSTWLVIKGQAGSVPPAWSVCYRFAVAAAGTFVLALLRRDRCGSMRKAGGWRWASGCSTSRSTTSSSIRPSSISPRAWSRCSMPC
ncbi:hypothetical protein ACFS32_22280 [Novosphingobium pokkalii]|uniref:hypothetical protein n=1 Tax=Novosphingobium pokkalii TaxID=1770194 RepID=UPI00364390FC